MLNTFSGDRMSLLIVEILAVGDELLRGELVDTNGPWLAEELGRLGLQVRGHVTVGDDPAPLTTAIREAAQRADLVLVTGGLGPTDDDRTAAAVASATGRELQLDRDVLEQLKERFARAGYPFSPNNEKQARFPRTSTILKNDRGTAPGFVVKTSGGALIACMPGVPSEMKQIFSEQLIPLLRTSLEQIGQPALIRVVKTFGIGESQIDHRLQGLLEFVEETTGARSRGSVTIHYRTSFPENSVILVVRPKDDQEPEQQRAEALLGALVEEVKRRLGRSVYGVDGTTFSDAVVRALRDEGATVALAESCTGGLAGDLITRASGSSEVFELSVVTYSNRCKHEILGVPTEILETKGAVSAQCVEAMALGVRRLARSTYGVAISGIAGPTGGSPEKPVGTVHFALASPEGVRHLQRCFPFDRQRVKLVSAYVALALVLRQITRDEDPDPFEGRWAADERMGGEQR
jgi:nicotinamide-nucleotide amidase